MSIESDTPQKDDNEPSENRALIYQVQLMIWMAIHTVFGKYELSQEDKLEKERRFFRK